MQSGHILGLVESVLASLGGPILLFSLVLVALWALLPFAVFGINKRLDASLDLQRDMLRELEKQREALRATDDAARKPRANA